MLSWVAVLVACRGATEPQAEPPWASRSVGYELRLHEALIGTEVRFTSEDGTVEERRRVTHWMVRGVSQRGAARATLRNGDAGWQRQTAQGSWVGLGDVWDRQLLPEGAAEVHDPWTGERVLLEISHPRPGVHEATTATGQAMARFDAEGMAEAVWGPLQLRRVLTVPTAWDPVDVAELLVVAVDDRSGSVVAPRRARVARWSAAGAVHQVESPLVAELARVPFEAPTVPTDDAVATFAQGAVAGTATTWLAHRALVDAVHRRVAWAPVPQGAQAEQTLAAGRGDCTEMVGLYLTAAEAVGLDARSAAGGLLVQGELRPHAWVEARIGNVWVAVDPTLGLAPADAARLWADEEPSRAAAKLQTWSPVRLLNLR